MKIWILLLCAAVFSSRKITSKDYRDMIDKPLVEPQNPLKKYAKYTLGIGSALCLCQWIYCSYMQPDAMPICQPLSTQQSVQALTWMESGQYVAVCTACKYAPIENLSKLAKSFFKPNEKHHEKVASIKKKDTKKVASMENLTMSAGEVVPEKNLDLTISAAEVVPKKTLGPLIMSAYASFDISKRNPMCMFAKNVYVEKMLTGKKAVGSKIQQTEKKAAEKTTSVGICKLQKGQSICPKGLHVPKELVPDGLNRESCAWFESSKYCPRSVCKDGACEEIVKNVGKNMSLEECKDAVREDDDCAFTLFSNKITKQCSCLRLAKECPREKQKHSKTMHGVHVFKCPPKDEWYTENFNYLEAEKIKTAKTPQQRIDKYLYKHLGQDMRITQKERASHNIDPAVVILLIVLGFTVGAPVVWIIAVARLYWSLSSRHQKSY